jgi:hypothetical protein
MIFLRAHQLLSEHNHQCVMALTPNSSPMLVTPDSCAGNSAALPALLLERLTHLLQAQDSSTTQQPPGAQTETNTPHVQPHRSACAAAR